MKSPSTKAKHRTLILNDHLLNKICKLAKYGARRHVAISMLHPDVTYTEYKHVLEAKNLPAHGIKTSGLLVSSASRYVKNRETRLHSTMAIGAYARAISHDIPHSDAIMCGYEFLLGLFGEKTALSLNEVFHLVTLYLSHEVLLSKCVDCKSSFVVDIGAMAMEENKRCPMCWLSKRKRSKEPFPCYENEPKLDGELLQLPLFVSAA